MEMINLWPQNLRIIRYFLQTMTKPNKDSSGEKNISKDKDGKEIWINTDI